MIRNLTDVLASRSRIKRARRAIAANKRSGIRKRLAAEPLESRRLLAVLYWQGDVDGNMSTVGNWADDVAGNESGQVPAAGDTLIFNRSTVGQTGNFATFDLPPTVNNLTIEHVGNVAGEPTFVINGGNTMGVVAVNHSGSNVNGGFIIQAPMELNADAVFTNNIMEVPNHINGFGYQNDVSGNFSLTLDGPSHVLQRGFGGQFSFTGPLNINGELIEDLGVTAPTPSTINVNNGGTLSGFVNATGPLNVLTGGTVSPGFSPGTVSSGDLNLADGSNFDIEINSPASLDQIQVTGSVTIGGVNFNILPTSLENPVPGTPYTIIDNDGADPVILGASAPSEGADVGNLNGVPMAISYVGGDGNDVVLEAIMPLNAVMGYKFEDLDGDGIEDPGEPRLNGIPFVLTDPTGGSAPVQTLTGDVDLNEDGVIDPATERGIWRFFNLDPAISYNVDEVEPPGFALTTFDIANLLVMVDISQAFVATNGLTGNLQLEEIVVPEYAVGNAVLGSIHGFKFEDIDGDGVYDPFVEPPLAGVTMTLSGLTGGGTTINRTTTTGSDGRFWFTDLLPGTYTLSETPPSGFFPTTPRSRTFGLSSRQEFVWAPGEANLPPNDPRVEILVGDQLIFGNTVPGSIHGFKFEDLDGNGIYDPANEPPLADITFTLTGLTGQGVTVTRTTTTDPTGRFWFTDVLPGTYTVAETVPAGFLATTPTSRTFGLASRQEFVWAAGEANLPPGDPRVEIVVGDQLIFGNTVPGSIHGFKFEDIDGNGVYDPAFEPPLAGVTVTLEGITGQGTTITQTTSTGSDGRYWFNDLLPGNYAVTETPPPGFVPTTPFFRFLTIESRQELVWEPGAAQLPPGDPRVEVVLGDQLIFGNTVPGSIHGFKFEDLNGNGLYEPNSGEGPLAGVEFRLTGTDGQGNMIDTQTFTDDNGNFWFTGLLPSLPGPGGPATGYTVTETVPPGFFPTTPTSFFTPLQSREELVAVPGQAMLPTTGDPRIEIVLGTPLIFGNTRMHSSIHGFKFEDIDGNGLYDPMVDIPAANVEFTLAGNDASGTPLDVPTTTTDQFGNFWFTELPPSDAAGYTVTETVPAGWVPTTPTSFNSVLLPGQELVAFPGQAMLQVDSEAEDGTGDGSITPRTNASGGQTVQLDAGESRTLDFSVMSDRTYEIGIRYSNDNFGPLETVEVLVDGMFVGAFLAQDTGDFGVGWENFVSDIAGSIALAAGPHTMTINVFGGDGFGVEVDLATVTATNAEEIVVGQPLQFGNTVPGSIHGIKFEDTDGDGVYNPNFETPLAGVTIELTGDRLTGPLTTTTGTDGRFWYTNLLPGTYTVTEIPPAGFVATTPTTRTFTILSRQELVWAPGEANLSPNDPQVEVLVGDQLIFGNTVPGSIHGFKFEDTDGNGIYDPNTEPPLENVTFTLTGTTGLGTQLTLTTATDSTGQFWFTNLLPGTYSVTETVPLGFVPTTSTSFQATLSSGDELVAFPGQYTPLFGAPQVDQTQTAFDQATGISDTIDAQTFVPDVTGQLTQATLVIIRDGAELTLEIQTVVGGVPSGVVLDTATVAAGAPTGFDPVTFDFTGLPSLTAGTPYALVLSSPDLSRWAVTGGDVYAAGESLISDDNGANWTPETGIDRAFTTLMQPLLNREIVVGQPLVFGNTVPGSIHGFKFEDLNGNGIYEPNSGEAPQAGVAFNLTGIDSQGNLIDRVEFTNDEGEFWFTGLLPSVDGSPIMIPGVLPGIATGYTLTEIVPPGFEPTTPTSRDFDLLSRQELVWTPGASDVDPMDPDDPRVEVLVGEQLIFGNTVRGSIHGFKFEDLNGNGVYEPNFGEVPQAGIAINLTGIDGQGNQIDRTVFTNQFGEFWFIRLWPSVNGTPSSMPGIDATGYTVTEIVPPGFDPTTPTVRNFDLLSRQELAWAPGAAMLPLPPDPQVDQSQTQSNNVLAFQLSSQVLPAGQIRLAQTFVPGITGQLTQVDISISRIVTGDLGDVIMEIQTLDASGDPSGTVLADLTIPMASVPDGTNQPLSFVFPTPPNLIAGTGYAIVASSPTSDPDAFGWDINDPNAPPNAGDLYLPGTAISSIDGGTSWLTPNPGFDLVFTTTMQPPSDPRVEVVVGDQLIFGNTVRGSIHGFKFEDLNANGVYEPFLGEAPLEGVEFVLTGTDGQGNLINEQEFTNANGEFWFTGLLPSVDGAGPGTGYTVTEVVPAGFVPTTPIQRTFDLFSRVELVWERGAAMLSPNDLRFEVIADSDDDLIGDELIFGNTVPGSIHGFKFEDIDGDGIYNPNVDLPLAGVDFTLTGIDNQGNMINLTETSNSDGEFWFTGLLASVDGQGPGTGYTVTETVPDGFVATTPTVFSSDLLSRQELVALRGQAMIPPDDPRGEVLVGRPLQFGNTVPGSIHGFKYEDVDANGVYDPAIDLPLAGVDFTLTGIDSQGNLINRTETTNANGDFWFTGLLPSIEGVGRGTGYTITETVPGGFIATTPTVFSTNLFSRQELVAFEGQAMLPTSGDPRVEVLVGSPLQFGNTVPGSIHGFKFEDVDGDGVYDPSIDQPLAGVEFTLTGIDGQGNVINRTETSDANGEFWFIRLLASVDGTGPATGYTVTETVPDDFVATTPTVFTTDLLSRQELVAFEGQAMIPADNPRVEVVVGTPLVFGNTLPGSIHGFKFEDFNANGIYEPNLGEVPQAGVEFTLTGTDGQGNLVNLQEFTNANGEFWFTGLLPSVDGAGPGTGYTVTEVVPAGFVATTPTQRTFDLTSRVEFVWARGAAMLPPDDLRFEVIADSDDDGIGDELIFGNTVFGSIHGFKFEDIDGDGIYDPTDEPPLSGVQFTLTGTPITGSLTVVTGDDGQFWFINLRPGTYTVTETVPDGFIPTTPTSRTFTIDSRVELVWTPGAAQLPIDDPRLEVLADSNDDGVGDQLIFGNTVRGSIHGFKFEDLDGDGVYDSTVEPPQENVVFTLSGITGQGSLVTLTTSTDSNGNFWFTNLHPGTYTVTETVPDGFIPTTPISRTFTIDSRIEFVWADGAANLPAGDPRTEVLADSNADGVGDQLIFGNTALGSIHGYKFKDVDGDGLDDDGLRVAGVTITLEGDVDGNGVVDQVVTQTDVNGEYWFEDLYPGNYTVTETPPSGTIPTTNTVANLTIISGEEAVALQGQSTLMGPLGPGQFESAPNSDLAFGNFFPGEIHGHKFEDVNGNGVEDAEDPRLNGWTIVLTDANGNDVVDFFGNTVDPVVTQSMDLDGDGNITPNEQGLYWFENLLPGTYLVREVQQNGYLQTTHDPQPIVITGGQIFVAKADQSEFNHDPARKVIIDKCLAFGNTVTSSIHGYKFDDLNGNGVDNNDPRVAGVTITLTGDVDGDGIQDQVVTQTDGNGDYWFEDIYPGTYTITETVPAGWVATKATSVQVTVTRGEEAVAEQGQSTAMGPLGAEQFESNPNPDLAFGNTKLGSIHGYKFKDVDGDGLDDDGLRVGGVTITLDGDVDGDGSDDQIVMVTDANGEYWFEDLYPGTYTVTETPPAGTIPTTNTSAVVTIISGEEAVAQQGQSTRMGPLGPGQFESNPNPDLAFGNFFPGSIHGHKFEDIDGDGVEDPGEPRLNGWTIELTDTEGNPVVDFFGNTIDPVVTQSMDLNGDGNITPNEEGLYWFENLLPGSYVVREVDQRFFFQTTHDPQPITITGGQIFVAKLDQTEFDHDPARKVIVDKCLSFGNQRRGEVQWEKRDKNFELLGGVIFELIQTHSYDQTTGLFTDIVDVPITVVDNLFPDIDPVFGRFTVEDLPLGRYDLLESMPIPGYDLDPFVETFEVTDTDPLHIAEHVWVNRWAKRAFVGSTYALRLEYLREIGLADVASGPEPGEGEPFRVGLQVAESEENVELIHQRSGIVVGEGELTQTFDVVTTELDENLVVEDLPRLDALTIAVGGGDDVVDIKSLDFESLDGGDGHDVLRLRELGEILLGRSGQTISGIEELELTADGQKLTISQSLLDLLTDGSPLRVRHQSGGQLNFSGQWEMDDPMLDRTDVVQVLRSDDATVYVVNDTPWQNVLNRFDVDASGGVSALDALVGINHLDRFAGDSLLASDHLPSKFFDVNGDSLLTAIDVLQVINQLTRETAEAELVAAPAASNRDATTDAALDQFAEAELLDSGAKAIASFDQASTATPSALATGLDLGADADDDELDSTLDMLASDSGR